MLKDFRASGCSSMTNCAKECTPMPLRSATSSSFNGVFPLIRKREGITPCAIAVYGEWSRFASMRYIRLRYPSGSGEVPPFPKVCRLLAWDSSFENPAAWPNILCEHLPGVTLQWIRNGFRSGTRYLSFLWDRFIPRRFLTTGIYILWLKASSVTWRISHSGSERFFPNFFVCRSLGWRSDLWGVYRAFSTVIFNLYRVLLVELQGSDEDYE